eukprot:10016841-Alexandrium_andersonii.AAC.1
MPATSLGDACELSCTRAQGDGRLRRWPALDGAHAPQGRSSTHRAPSGQRPGKGRARVDCQTLAALLPREVVDRPRPAEQVPGEAQECCPVL